MWQRAESEESAVRRIRHAAQLLLVLGLMM